MGFLANQSTKHNRLITICNWEYYQSQALTEGKENGNQTANDRQTTGSQWAPNKNVKNEKNTKKHMRDDFYLSSEEREIQQANESFEKAKAEFLRRANDC
ncbi:MAG: hypothetical protein ABFR90_02110 [Planctomycetota bacterium]